MRKFILFISVIVVFVAGWIFYLNKEKKNFIENLPQSPAVVNQPINNSSSSVNEMEDSNDFVEVRVVEVDGEIFIPDARVHETLPQEQTASAEKKTSSETPTPDEKADFVRDQWIQMFGDIPQVHTLSEYMRKIYKRERMTIDEEIAGLEAAHYLFPEGGHGLMLAIRKTQKAQGLDEDDFEIVYEEDLENVRPPPGYKEYHFGNVPEHLRSDAPTPDSISSESIDGDIDFLPARSEGTPVVPEPKTSVTTEHVHHEDGHVHEKTTPPAAKSMADVEKQLTPEGIEAELSDGLSPDPFDKAQQLIDEYGIEEGLRRLRESDPEAAQRFERERRGTPSREVPSGDTHPDDQSPDDSP
jgi:hypothetical protein